MVGVYERKRSGAAIWCQRFAIFLIPYFLLVIILYRLNNIETGQLFALIALGFALCMLALVLAIRASYDLWTKGYKGGKATVRGLIVTLIVLLPFLYYGYLGLLHPLANDISTDPFDPPSYINASTTRLEFVHKGMNPIEAYGRDYAETIVAAYPKVRSRRYPAGAERVLEAVQFILSENEWKVTGTLGVPDADPNAELEDNVSNNDDNQSVDEGLEAPDDIYVEAIETTLVFGFENDVVIRIVSEAENTLVDLRSSSRWGEHDFGHNAQLIESFLGQLDIALLGIAGEG